MLQTSAPLLTRQDYEAMREGPPYSQVIEGTLVISPSPTTIHQQIVVRLAAMIEEFLDRRPLGSVFVAPLDVFLNDINVVQPDILFIANDRRSIIAEHGIEGAPNLVIEVLSPKTAEWDRGPKRKIYAQSGVEELWLIDPRERTTEIFRLTETPEVPTGKHSARSIFASKILPGLKIDSSEIFKTVRRGQ